MSSVQSWDRENSQTYLHVYIGLGSRCTLTLTYDVMAFDGNIDVESLLGCHRIALLKEGARSLCSLTDTPRILIPQGLCSHPMSQEGGPSL